MTCPWCSAGDRSGCRRCASRAVGHSRRQCPVV